MRGRYRRRISLMPAIAMAGLSALMAIPTLSHSTLYAAQAEHFSAVMVKPGESLWTIADRFTTSEGDVQSTVDRIMAVNHLRDATLQPGQHLLIPR